MSTITLINWIIIAIYGIYGLFVYFSSNGSGMDAAGRGMAMGYLLIGLIYLAVLIGLNLINVKWVRILVLVLGGFPLIYFPLQTIANQLKFRQLDKQGKELSKFQNPHLQEMMVAIKSNQLQELGKLLETDNTQINHIGETNRKTLLEVAVRNAWASEHEDAAAMVHLLLDNGADPNVFHPDTYGTYAPLAAYGEYINIPVFEALLDAGADPSATGENSIPILYTLIKGGREDTYEKVALLLAHGLDANLPLGDEQPYQLNYSPLVWAAHYEQWAICNLLLEHGSDINFQPPGPDGRTFWFILEGKGKEYQQSGNTPVEYEELLLNEQVKNGGK